MTAPVIDYMMSGWGLYPDSNITVSPSTTKISRQSGKDITTFSFTPDADYQAYQLRAVPGSSSPVSAGTQLEAGSGGLAGVQRDVDLTDDELVAAGVGDGTHLVKIFIRNYAGNWTSDA